MQKSNAPAIITVPFASGAGSGYRNTIPIPSQIPVTPGAASWTDGFPPLTMTQPGAGGIPPYGQDMNGLGFALSTVNQWTQLGFVAAYSSSVSTAIGGYPQGACLGQLGGLGYWLSTADNNTTNPDTTGATNWVAIRANAGRSTIAVAAGTVTPDPSVLGAPLLVLSGTLTANVTLVLPLTQPGAAWSIYNATTGAFTVNVQGATGSGVVAAQGSLTDVRTDGTNFYTSSLSGGPFLPLHGTADAATKLATARTIAMTGDVSWTSAAFDGSANVTGVGTIQAGAVTLAKMANLAANTLLGNPTGAAATPQAIALANGLQFAGGNLGLGAITPTGVTTSGGIAALGTVVLGGMSGNTDNKIRFITDGAGGTRIDSVTSNGSAFAAMNFYSSAYHFISGSGTFDGNLAAYNLTANGGSVQIGLTGNQLTTINYGGYVTAGNRTINPNASSGLTLNLSGSFGGGLSMQDPGGGSWWGNYTASGSMLWGYNANSGAAFSTRMSIDANGNLTVIGTINFSASDTRVKTNFKKREPIPTHQLWWGDYDRTDVKAHGIGHTAQDLRGVVPHHVYKHDQFTVPGTTEPLLVIDRLGVVEEQGIWNGREIDKLWEAVRALQQKVN